jgi:hypothetical protein
LAKAKATPKILSKPRPPKFPPPQHVLIAELKGKLQHMLGAEDALPAATAVTPGIIMDASEAAAEPAAEPGSGTESDTSFYDNMDDLTEEEEEKLAPMTQNHWYYFWHGLMRLREREKKLRREVRSLQEALSVGSRQGVDVGVQTGTPEAEPPIAENVHDYPTAVILSEGEDPGPATSLSIIYANIKKNAVKKMW